MGNKKAIMIKFLVTVILAILIFAPACMLGSKIFRTSTQAKDNYVDFVKELNEFAKSKKPLGAKSSFVLIMDEETAVVYYEKNVQEVTVKADVEAPEDDYVMHIKKPSQCSDDQLCLCLFRKAEFEFVLRGEGWPVSSLNINPERVVCTHLDYKLDIESCGMGEPNDINSYVCSNGFLIERKFAEDASIDIGGYYENSRRRTIYMTKMGDTILLAGASVKNG